MFAIIVYKCKHYLAGSTGPQIYIIVFTEKMLCDIYCTITTIRTILSEWFNFNWNIFGTKITTIGWVLQYLQ